MQRNSQPISWKPKGLSDVLDATGAFPGAMASLQNLIPDPSTPELWQCRPASILTAHFGGSFSSGFSSGFQTNAAFASPGFISCLLIVGNLAFGMVATSRNPGNDEPFCFNLATSSFITVGGIITTTTTPVSPPTTGDWQPPQMAVIGSKVMVCHSGFSGLGGNFMGWFDVSTPTSPVWHAGNFTYPAGGFQFAVPPTGIAQFNGRAYYIYNLPAQPAVVFSDVLNPLTNSGSVTPILTFGDNELLTAIAGVPLSNQFIGGVVQSLMVFKNVLGIFQITGDSSTNNLAINSLNVQTGTFAANSLTSTPKGLAFVAPDGLRIIDFSARVSDPIGIDGKGVNVPFQLVVFPTRINMACNSNILRIFLFNGNVGGAPAQEYWYDFARAIFHGPHSFPLNIMDAYLNSFVGQPQSSIGNLWRSDTIQSLTSTYVENGVQMTWQAFSSYLPSTEKLTNNCMTEGTIELALAPGIPPITVSAINSQGSVIDTVSISGSAGSTLWGSFTWGSALWGGVTSLLAPRQLQWHLPVTFTKVQLQTAGQSAQNVKVGRLELRYQVLRQWTNIAAVA